MVEMKPSTVVKTLNLECKTNVEIEFSICLEEDTRRYKIICLDLMRMPENISQYLIVRYASY